MRICLLCNDTRGGVQPYLALGLGLKRAGVDAVVVAPEGYRGDVESNGLGFAGLSGDTEASLRSPEVREAMGRGFLATHKLMLKHVGEMVRAHMREALAGCEGADAILGGFGGMIVGQPVAERLGVPFLQAHLQPLTTTSAFPGLLSVPGLGWLGPHNRLSHGLSRQAFWLPMQSAVASARKDVLGLPPVSRWGNVGRPGRAGDPVLYGYSPSFLPRPADWPAWAMVTGYWFLDRPGAWSPPPALDAFLAAGPPPVAVGFGSMGSGDAGATARLVLDAVGRAGQRVVLISGWGGMSADDLPPWALLVDAVPHDWLFPRCAAAVHHGGAGTTGAALRAGIPSIIVPFGADQPFWARLVAARGVGTSPGSRKRLTAAKLGRAIAAVVASRETRERSADLGRRIRDEDGVGCAVGLILDTLSGRARSVA